ncbi:hypothetical protein HNP47_001583 [Brevundimonas vesicularis]|uniref:Uncharacterized protein n=1 Tax=Brevundimonas vesicularis TaxID=41276 RepID=A0A7W9L5Q7_BREVE|nr:hypothetical protein [Brevundimonas vesicularis]
MFGGTAIFPHIFDPQKSPFGATSRPPLVR